MKAKQPHQRTPAPDRYLRQKQLIGEGFIPFSHATLWRRVGEGTFPAPVKISVGVTAWRESDIVEWQRNQAAGSKLVNVSSLVKANRAKREKF